MKALTTALVTASTAHGAAPAVPGAVVPGRGVRPLLCCKGLIQLQLSTTDSVQGATSSAFTRDSS